MKIIKRALMSVAILAVSACANIYETSTIEVEYGYPAPLGMKNMKDKHLVDDLPVFLSSQLRYPKMPLHKIGLFSATSELAEVKRIIDHHFVYKTDQQMFGVREDWRPSTQLPQNGRIINGDCEDYAITVRAMLLKRGISSRLLLVETEYKGLYHVVVESSGWIIDNRESIIVSHEHVDYKIISMSDFDLLKMWHSVKK